MKPSQLFAVAVRVIGLVSMLYLLSSLPLIFGGGLSAMFLLRLIVWAGVSVYLLSGAPVVVKFAYPGSEA